MLAPLSTLSLSRHEGLSRHIFFSILLLGLRYMKKGSMEESTHGGKGDGIDLFEASGALQNDKCVKGMKWLPSRARNTD